MDTVSIDFACLALCHAKKWVAWLGEGGLGGERFHGRHQGISDQMEKLKGQSLRVWAFEYF